MKTARLLVPLTLYLAALVAPEHARLGLVQVNTPAREMVTVAPDHVPGAGTIVPRSRSCSQVRISGFTMLAETETDGAASAGLAVSSASAANVIAARVRRRSIRLSS